MSADPERRDDISKFLVHLTRDVDDIEAIDNLISILKDKVIKAKNPHCLFNHEFSRLHFSLKLTKKFNVVCLTETPLNQINNLTKEIPKRQVKLKPFGLVFWKNLSLKKGANPAIYINAKGTCLKNFLLDSFRKEFYDKNKFENLKNEESVYYNEIIQYYSLINVVQNNHDFMWEREWRFLGDLKFDYNDIVAIIADNPNEFRKKCEFEFNGKKLEYINRIPIISPEWSYEEVIEEMSYTIWDIKN